MKMTEDTKVKEEVKAKQEKKEDVHLILPTAKELVEAGAHWGHLKHRVYPKNYKNIHGVKSNAHIINVYNTLDKLGEAIIFMKNILDNNKQVLFVITKPSMKLMAKDFAVRMEEPYIDERWVGGSFTNFDFIEKSINKLKKIRRDFKSGAMDKYPRHEQLEFQRELERLQTKFGGLEDLDINKVGAVFIQDIKRDKIAKAETIKKGIPIIALVDTNINPNDIDYPIPCNDDSYEGLKLILDAFEKNLM